jgi:hypothetical protein
MELEVVVALIAGLSTVATLLGTFAGGWLRDRRTDWRAELKATRDLPAEVACCEQHLNRPGPSPLSAMEYSRGLTVICDDGIHWLEDHARSLPRDALIYCDPPYVMSTRKSGPWYRYEMTEEQHEALIAILNGASCNVILSGYWSSLYGERLAAPRWRRSSFLAMTLRWNLTGNACPRSFAFENSCQ